MNRSIEEVIVMRPPRDGSAGHDVWAAFAVDRPPALDAAICRDRWQALNLLLQSLVFLRAESKGGSPFSPVLHSACAIGAARRGLLYLQQEGSRRSTLAASLGYQERPPGRLRAANVMAAVALQRSKPILVDTTT